MLKYDYNKKFDILNLQFSNTDNSYGEEKTPGIVLLKDIQTENITGITFFGFKKKYNENRLPVLALPGIVDYNLLNKKISKM